MMNNDVSDARQMLILLPVNRYKPLLSAMVGAPTISFFCIHSKSFSSSDFPLSAVDNEGK